MTTVEPRTQDGARPDPGASGERAARPRPAAPEWPSATGFLAETGAAIRYENAPADVIFLAKQCFLDWVGVALAGAREPLSEILLAEIEEAGGNPQATVLGRRLKVPALQAALVNGAASHALDYDDVNTAMAGHPSVPVFPGLLALAEKRGASGRDFIAAFIAGFETECRLGLLVNPAHYAAGWHATGTLGTFGAAAACASLLDLDHDRWRNALGIAAAQAAGLKSMFGTMCKPFHAGKAAANGLMAATLAARGFTSNPNAIEVAQGFAATQASVSNPEQFFAGPAEQFAIRSVLFKYHAACYGTHSTIEGILQLKEDHHLAAADVRSIQLRVPEAALSMCNIQEPVTALEGKFSLRFTAALALGGDDTSELAFTNDRVRDPALRQILERVTVTGERGPVGHGLPGGTKVRLELEDGRALETSVDVNIPASDLNRQWQRLEAKFMGLAVPVVGAAAARSLVEAIARLDEVPDIRAITGLCVPEPSPAAGQ